MLLSIFKRILPEAIVRQLRKSVKALELKRGKRKLMNYNKVLEDIRGKRKINIAFFVVESSMWKYDELFKLFLEDPLFDPKIIICPYLNFKGTQMVRIMNDSKELFEKKGYPYILSYDMQHKSFVSTNKYFPPDIIFYCFPYIDATKTSLFDIYKYPESLICYVPYSSMVCNLKMQFDKPIQNFAWKFFVENDLVLRLVCENSPTKGVNAVATGFPSLDIYRNEGYIPQNVWKHNQPLKIIWAPHYTISDNQTVIAFSTFLQYFDIIPELAKRYSNKIQIAFKPHPFLYPTLCQYWGKIKTDEYYKMWDELSNTQYVIGEYIDLFKTSDAMIFDSVSFIVEYLYTKKKSLFTYKKGVEYQLNTYGLLAFECHQKSTSKVDVENFILDLIEEKEDVMKKKKEDFYDKYLSLPEGKSASLNIYNCILDNIKNKNEKNSFDVRDSSRSN